MNIEWENGSVDISRWLCLGRGHVVAINGRDYCIRSSRSKWLIVKPSDDEGEPIKGEKRRRIRWTQIEDLRIY